MSCLRGRMLVVAGRAVYDGRMKNLVSVYKCASAWRTAIFAVLGGLMISGCQMVHPVDTLDVDDPNVEYSDFPYHG
ncbi:MAG: hypothetical protein ACI9OU_000741 [Candidatus Promineifilaceae bacterium]|jgi:hypothetical protein